MPVYEFHCDACDQTHEVLQKFSDAPLDACPKCGGPVRKLMSATSFALKGTGWYTTDYKRAPAAEPKANPELAGGEKPAESSSTEKAEAPAEKPVEKSADKVEKKENSGASFSPSIAAPGPAV